jgi:RNA polymerase sigma-70 factor (ECF subfamily)
MTVLGPRVLPVESSIPGTDVVTSDKADVDGALVARIARGDPAALGELYDRHGRTVFGALYRMLGAPEPAEEVAQDAFHSVWRRAGTYRADRGSVRTWLLAIARNAAIDWRRTKGRRSDREAAIDEAAELVEEIRVDDRVIASLRAERVRAAVASLPDEQRVVLSLAFWSGLSQSEIATRTRTPLGTVKSRVRLGMAKLRDQLRPEAERA